MPNRFGGAGDFSSVFAQLATNNLRDLQAEADQLAQRNQDSQDAKDQHMFDEYNAGKINGDEILAYIKQRAAQTGWDPKQHANWQQALLQYTQSINDSKAEGKYAQTGDIHGLIAYYQGQLGGAKKNSPEGQKLADRIRQLQDQAVADDVQRGAERLSSQINSGKATLSDLLSFYQQHLRSSRPGSAMRQQIQQAIDDTRNKVTQQNFEGSLAQIQHQVQTQKLTPQQGGAAIRQLVNDSPLHSTDPARYYSLLDDATKMSHTVDDQAQLAKIQYDLTAGNITPAQAEQAYYAEADKFKSFDPSTYYALRTQGFKIGHDNTGVTPLPNAPALGDFPGFAAGGLPTGGLPTGGTGPGGPGITNGPQYAYSVDPAYGGPGGIRWISQLDGTAFANTNCAAASAAMLAYSMGVRGLSGGDLRYLTGDTQGGTMPSQYLSALQGVGVKGLDSQSGMDFNAFKARIAAGSTGVVAGVEGNVPTELRFNPNFTSGHSMFIAQYDAKKNAFLVMDPAAKNGKNGQWWSANIIKNFGWGPAMGGYSFHGDVLLSPTGTVKPGTANPTNIRYVSVNDLPQRPNTPKSYVGLNNPGPSGQAPGQHPTVTSGGNPKASPGIQFDKPATVEQAQKDITASQNRIDTITAMTDAYSSGQTSITIGGSTFGLDPGTIKSLHDEQLQRLDYEVALNEAINNTGGANQLRDARAGLINSVKAANTVPVLNLWNTLVRDVQSQLAIANFETDPAKAYQAILDAQAKLEAFAKVKEKVNPNDPFSGLGTIPSALDPNGTPQTKAIDLKARIDASINALKIASDKTLTPDDRIQQITDTLGAGGVTANEPIVAITQGVSKATNETAMLENGTGMQVLINATNPDGTPILDKVTGQPHSEIVVAPLIQEPSVDAMGNPTTIQVPDISQWAPGTDVNSLPKVIIDGSHGPIAIPALPYNMYLGTLLKGPAKSDAYLVAADLQKYSGPGGARLLQDDINAKTIVGVPYYAQAVKMPDKISPVSQLGDHLFGVFSTKPVVDGEIHAMDPGTGKWVTITPGVLPAFIDSRGPSVPGIPRILAYNDQTQSPDFKWADPSGALPAPYDGSNAKAVQAAIDNGTIKLPSVFNRDQFGGVDPTPVTPSYFNPVTPWQSGAKSNDLFGPSQSSPSVGSPLDAFKQFFGQGTGTPGQPSPFVSDVPGSQRLSQPGMPSVAQTNGGLPDMSSLVSAGQMFGINIQPPTSTLPTATEAKFTPPAAQPVSKAKSNLPKINLPTTGPVTQADPYHPPHINMPSDPGARIKPKSQAQRPYAPPPPTPTRKIGGGSFIS